MRSHVHALVHQSAHLHLWGGGHMRDSRRQSGMLMVPGSTRLLTAAPSDSHITQQGGRGEKDSGGGEWEMGDVPRVCFSAQASFVTK